jgi:hypothetical protein
MKTFKPNPKDIKRMKELWSELEHLMIKNRLVSKDVKELTQ